MVLQIEINAIISALSLLFRAHHDMQHYNFRFAPGANENQCSHQSQVPPFPCAHALHDMRFCSFIFRLHPRASVEARLLHFVFQPGQPQKSGLQICFTELFVVHLSVERFCYLQFRWTTSNTRPLSSPCTETVAPSGALR